MGVDMKRRDNKNVIKYWIYILRSIKRVFNGLWLVGRYIHKCSGHHAAQTKRNICTVYRENHTDIGNV